MSVTLTGGAETAAFSAVNAELHVQLHSLTPDYLPNTFAAYLKSVWTETGWLIEAFEAFRPAMTTGDIADMVVSRCHYGTVALCDKPLTKKMAAALLDQARERGAGS